MADPGSSVKTMKRAKSVDDYIKSSENWQDELNQLREILNSTELAEEIKWGAPCYLTEPSSQGHANDQSRHRAE